MYRERIKRSTYTDLGSPQINISKIYHIYNNVI